MTALPGPLSTYAVSDATSAYSTEFRLVQKYGRELDKLQNL